MANQDEIASERPPSVDHDARPVHPATLKPIAPLVQPGYYPDYDVLGQKAFWDEATRKVVLDRIEKVPPIRFFTSEEAVLMKAVCDRVLPQDDRDELHRIPVVNFIDERLHEQRLDGYRYESMPSDRDSHRLGLQGIEAIAQYVHRKSFVKLTALEQELVLKTVHDGEPPAGDEIWRRMPVHRYWLLLVQDVVGVYYAHPYAWNEIGFGGPAYPRGYMRLERGEREPWEANERRYEWAAPPNSPSAEFSHVGKLATHHASPGQGGTH